jgi:hypothetical protein
MARAWATRVVSVALAFWGGGLLAYAHRHGWQEITQWWTRLPLPAQVTLLLGALSGVAFSEMLMEWFQDGLLRLAEGYWPRWLEGLRSILVRRWISRMERKEERWNDLAAQCEGDAEMLSPREREEYTRLDAELAYFPVDPAGAMPSRLGNILRAAEEYPQVRYGLGATVCWPRLWLLLPEGVQKEMTAARERLNGAARLLGWGVLFLLWVVWAWWAVPVGLGVVLLAYRRIVMAALIYGALLRAAFDLYRFSLYEQLRLGLPCLEKEEAFGRRVTEYLFRGTI